MSLAAKNFRLWLLDQEEIAELVTGGIHAVRKPQPRNLPAVVLKLVSMVPVTSNDGYSGLRTMRFQVDVYAAEFDDVEPVSEAIFEALEGFAGYMRETHVTRAHLVAARDIDEDDVKEFHRILDWELWEESRP